MGAQFYYRMNDFYGGQLLKKISDNKEIIDNLDSGWIFFIPKEK